MPTIAMDEEIDPVSFRNYLRTQSNEELLDIVRHLDPERYPARLDAAEREARRRGITAIPADTLAESTIRYFSLLQFALAGATIALALSLSSSDAAGPSWPNGAMMPDGTPMSHVMGLFYVDILRGIVVWSVHGALYPGLLISTLLLITQEFRAGGRRREIYALATLSFVLLSAAIAVAAAPPSKIDPGAAPSVLGVPVNGSQPERIGAFLDPFGS